MEYQPSFFSKFQINKLGEFISRQYNIYLNEIQNSTDPLIEYLKALGGTVKQCDPSEIEKNGSDLKISDGKFEILCSNSSAPLKNRFIIAHNIGHYILHTKFGETKGKFPEKISSRLESEASWFALGLLLPKKKLRLYGNTKKIHG